MSPDHIDHAALTHKLCLLYSAKASELFVVLNKAKTGVLKAPGLNEVWCSRHKRQAEQLARESGGIAITLKDYLDHLDKELSKN